MPIIVAKNIGFCFGVKRAVKLAKQTAIDKKSRVYTLGELIHNPDVVDRLKKENNVYPIDSIDGLNSGDTLIIRSHGAPEQVIENCRSKGITVVDATCPFVKKIHKIVKEQWSSRQVIIVGTHNHPEVVGIAGNCKNSITVQTVEEAEAVEFANKACVVAQTTFNKNTYYDIVDIIKNRIDDVVVFDTTCDTTKIRQDEADSLSKRCDEMIVIGGANSSNTKKLIEICKNNCKKVHSVENCFNITLEKINFNGIIGLVAGASTPDWMIMEVLRMENHGTENFAELLAAEEANQKVIKPNTRVDGVVLSSTEERITVNLSYKADGVLPKSEFTNPDMYKEYNEGDPIVVYIDKKNDGEGQVLLKMRKSQYQTRQVKISETFLKEENWKDKVFDAVVKEVVVKNGIFMGLSVIVEDTRVFVPGTKTFRRKPENVSVFDKYIDQVIQVKIESVGKSEKEGSNQVSIIASAVEYFDKVAAERKEEIRAQNEAKKAEVIAELSLNQQIRVKVRSIRFKENNEFAGIFAEIRDGVCGYIPASQFDWDRTVDVKKAVSKDDEIDVVVIKLDVDNNLITLSRKQLIKSPWDDLDVKYPRGAVIECKVVSISERIALVQLEPMIKGIISIGDVALKRIEKIEDEISVGEIIHAMVISNEEAPYKDKNGRERMRPRICLSRREAILEENPELRAEYEKAREEQRALRRERNEAASRKPRQDSQRGDNGDQPRPERKPRREEVSYTLPEEERSTTSLASLFGAFETDGEE